MPTFTPPVDHYGNDGPQEPLWVWFIHFDRGLSVLKTGSVYATVPFPTTDEIDAASEVYLGGHIHTITSAQAAALTTAGYGAYIT